MTKPALNISSSGNGGLDEPSPKQTPVATKSVSDTQELRAKVAESIRQEELTEVEKWLEKEGEYYGRYPNEIIYAHTLVKAMRAVQADNAVIDLELKDLEASND